MRALTSVRWFGPAVLVSAAIFWLSHQPVLPAPPGNDKLAHVIAYTVLGATYVRALLGGTGWGERVALGAAFVAASLYGVFDELHQSLVPGRDASSADVVADVIGAAIGTAAAFAVYRRLRKA